MLNVQATYHQLLFADMNTLEFTVETISPLALLFGALTADTWTPSPEVKLREPRDRIEDLPFYTMP